MTTYFDHPWALWLLAAVPVALALTLHCWRRQRQSLARLGDIATLRRLARVSWPARRWKAAFFLCAVCMLALGIAGPRWGVDPRGELAVTGRDLVVVLDLSRSMLAEQPSRQERARRALADLSDTLERHGGHRIALVIFAAHPRLAFPLTSDYDHFRAVMDKLDADSLPPDMRPDAERGQVSGTRIGAALALAVEAHDSRFAGAQNILLLTDGDDPGEDDEWARGVVAAREKNIPVFVVGLGDPVAAHSIPYRDGSLRYHDEPVMTRLNERPLEEIARRTGGAYIPARTETLPLGRWFREVIEAGRDRPDSELESWAQFQRLRPRHAWFLGIALLLFSTALLKPNRKSLKRSASAVNMASIALLAFCLIAASAAEIDDLIRQGNDAYATNDYQAALQWFTRAEEQTSDPGLVAFNKGTALFRLGKFREAELHFRRCLEDSLAPPPRRARAWFDLGNCLMKQASPEDAKTIENALDCYREAMRLAGADKELVADARHNFEIARLLWLEARARSPKSPEHLEPKNGSTKEPKSKENGAAKSNDKPEKSHEKSTEKNGDEPASSKDRKKVAAQGKLLVLPEDERLVPLSPEDTASFLERTRQRVLRERREYWQQAAPASDQVKDW